MIFSCANATCAIPGAYRDIFHDSEDVISSPLGWEPGALNLAQAFAMKLKAPILHGDISRLLIDLEQYGEHSWSEFANKLPDTSRNKLVDRHAAPFYSALSQRIADDLKIQGSALHLMVHTTDQNEGTITLESYAASPFSETLAAQWLAAIDHNGIECIHTTQGSQSPLLAALISEANDEAYAPIKLTVSQSFFLSGTPWRWSTLKKHLVQTFAETIQLWQPPAKQHE